MSSALRDIIAAMEFAARQNLGHFARQDGKTRLSLWRETVGVAVPTGRPTPENSLETGATNPAAGIVGSPLAGLCHLSPEPGGSPFVSEGDNVEIGQTICLIEAMKVMTSVPAAKGGTVSKILVLDGAAVRAGDPLIEVRP